MYAELLHSLKNALLTRNPGIASGLKPPLPPDTIQKQLKRAGYKGHIDPIVQLYSWHNGATAPTTKHVNNLGFTPPIISEPLPANIEFLRSLGHKIDPNLKCYGSFVFFDFDSVIRILKLWKKFQHNSPDYVRLLGRAIPFLRYSQTGQELALDTDPSANTRIISIQPSNMKPEPFFRLAYLTFTDFLHDAIHANQNHQPLTWPQTPGQPIDLPLPTIIDTPIKSKKKTLPETKNIPIIRTDFSNDPAWESLRAILSNPDDPLAPTLDFISDPTFDNLTPKQLPKLLPDSNTHPFAVLIDQTTLTHPDHPLLLVDLQESPGKSFRTIPSTFPLIHDNLSLANMDFTDFASNLDPDKIFRTFKE